MQADREPTLAARCPGSHIYDVAAQSAAIELQLKIEVWSATK